MINYNSYFSAVLRKMGTPYLFETKKKLRELGPTPVDLAFGLLDPVTFPVKEATLTLKTGEVLHLPQNLINESFQYGHGNGFPELRKQLLELVNRLVAPPHLEHRAILTTCGAQGALFTIMLAFVNPGDYVFISEASYPTFISNIKMFEARGVAIPEDHHGLRADLLRDALENSSDGCRKLLYVVPHGNNPTGVTFSEERQREIYKLACKYNILIVEDDPYYFLQYSAQPVLSSFLSLDTEGRVLRVDSFAKTIGGGLRIGYVTADKPFIEKLTFLQALIVMQPPGLPQVVISEMLRFWGIDGFLEMIKREAQLYHRKRDTMLRAAAKHLTGLCEWTEADGMFLWVKVLGIEDVRNLVEKRCVEAGLMILTGNELTLDSKRPCPYIRVSFSKATEEEQDKGFRILANMIKEELKKN